jgi:hypothetical protein
MMKAFDSGRSAAIEAPVESMPLSERWFGMARQRRCSLLALAGIVALMTLAAVYHYAIYLPQPDRPHLLTLLDDLFACEIVGLIGLDGLILGCRLLRPFRLAGFSRLERGALAVGLGWGLLSLGVLTLGFAHLLYAWLLIAGLGLVPVIFWRDAWRLLATLTNRSASYWHLGIRLPRSLFLRSVLIMLLVEVALLGTQALTLPYLPRGFDLYQYHWAVPKLYLLHHAIYALPGWAHANFPFNSEMLNTLALAFHSPIAAVLLQATFGILAIVLLAGFLYRRFGRLAAWMGVALCLSSELIAGVLISGYAEVAVTYYGVAAVIVALTWVERMQKGEPGPLRLLFLAGLFAGFGLGTKYTEGQIVVGVLLLLFGLAIISGIRALRKGKPATLARWGTRRVLMILAPFTFGLAALLPLLPWLLKDWVLLGNPIYPFIWGGPGWDAARTQVGVITFAHFGPRGLLWQRFLTGIFYPFWDTGRTDDPPYAPPNLLLLLALLVPLGWLIEEIRQRKKQRASPPEADAGIGSTMPWLVVIGGGYMAWILSHAAIARYGIPWIILLSVPAAAVLVRARQVRWPWPLLRVIAQLLRALLPGAILLCMSLGLLYQVEFWLFASPLSLLTGSVSLRQWEERHILDTGYWHMVDYVEGTIPRDARLLLLGRGTGYFLTGYDYVADSGEDWIPYLETEGRTPAGILALLRQDHFRYVVYEEKTLEFVIHTYENSYLASFLPAFRQFLASSLVQVWSYQNFHIYRIPSP